MASYRFILKKKAGNSDAFIYLRYNYKDTDCLISTGKKIIIKQWDEENQRPRSSFKGGTTTLMTFLNNLQGEVMKAATQLENEGELPLPEEVKIRYTQNKSGIVRGAVKVSSQWEQFIKEGEGKKEQSTIDTETDSLNTFVEFTQSINKAGLTLKRIDKDLITHYTKHLSTYADNTRAKKLKHFKAFLKSAGHPSADLVKYKEHAGDKIYLTEDELTAIENHALKGNPLMIVARDLLSLQCETGLRVSDLMRIGKEHIQGDSLLLRAKKNDEFIRMPISSKIKEILIRYNHAIPQMADQTYNEQIKEIAKLAITESKVELTEHRGGKKTITTCLKSKVLSSHACVRTFINLAAARGMPVVSIAALTGKTVATLLKSYLKPNQEQAFKDAVTYARTSMAVNR